MSRVAPARWARRQFNRLVVVVGAMIILPSVAGLERVRAGAGRAFARAGIRLVMVLTGVGMTVHVEAAGGAGSSPPGGPGESNRSRGAAGSGRTGGPGGQLSVVVANHSSLLDIAVLMLALPDVRFLAAADLYRIPLLASALRALGCVPIDRRQPRRGREQIEALVAAGPTGTLAVFPEGAIRASGALKFKTGAFELASRTGAVVWPVAIRGAAAVLPPGSRLAVRPGSIEVHLLKPIGPAEAGGLSRRELRDRAEAAVLAGRGEPAP
ncbi:MAG: lysophospholipid acyltransferase family protein [Acidimicrobiales bacterium]